MNKTKGPPLRLEDFSSIQRQGKHSTTLGEEGNLKFLRHCIVAKRHPADLLRMVVDEYYAMMEKEVADKSRITGPQPGGSEVFQFGPRAVTHPGHTHEQKRDQDVK